MRYHFLILFAIVSAPLLSFGQTEKGRFVISGGTDLSAFFSQTKYKGRLSGSKSDGHSFTVAPGIGYFVADNLALGISASYKYHYTRTPRYIDNNPGGGAVHYGDNISTTTAVVPSLSYYIPSEKKLKPVISVGAGYAFLKEKDSYSGADDHVVYEYGGLSLNGAAGVAYFISKAVSFNALVQYTNNSLKEISDVNEKQTTNAFGLMLGISVFL